MKKKLAILSAAALVCCAAASVPASAADAPKITVTIANAGKLEVAEETIALTDADGDGALTVNDALMLTHYQYYGEEGYVTVTSDWGMSIQTLWGVTNGGSYGYTINDVFANSLTDTLNDGDYLYAYVYQDAATYSDTYSYFDVKDAGTVTAGDSITLTLNSLVFDENWKQQSKPVSGATIVINGELSEYETDENGQVTIKAEQAGNLQISAYMERQILVPPICKATVQAAETTETTSETTGSSSSATTASASNGSTVTVVPGAKTGDTDMIPVLVITALLAGCTAFMMRRQRED